MWKILVLLVSIEASAYTFKYISGDVIIIKQSTYEIAYKEAAKKCFRLLTNNNYPGEEKGLDIIDICANPKEVNEK